MRYANIQGATKITKVALSQNGGFRYRSTHPTFIKCLGGPIIGLIWNWWSLVIVGWVSTHHIIPHTPNPFLCRSHPNLTKKSLVPQPDEKKNIPNPRLV